MAPAAAGLAFVTGKSPGPGRWGAVVKTDMPAQAAQARPATSGTPRRWPRSRCLQPAATGLPASPRPSGGVSASGPTSLRLAARMAASAVMMLADLAAPDRQNGSAGLQLVIRWSQGQHLTCLQPRPLSGHGTAPPENVTVTPSGARVVDRRRAALHSAAKRASGESPDTVPVRRHAEEKRSRMPAIARGCRQGIRQVRYPCLAGSSGPDAGRRFLWCPMPISGATPGSAGPAAGCLRGKPGRQEDLSELVGLAADQTAGDWRAPVLWWAKRHVPPADLAGLIQAEFTVPGVKGSPSGT